MEPVALIAVGVALILGLVVNRRYRLIGLNWKSGLHQKQIAERCARYLRLRGLDAVTTDDAVYDVWIHQRQFPNKIGTFLLICRDRKFILVETLFMDIKEMALRVKGATPIIVTPSAICSILRGYASKNEIAIIHVSELQNLAIALQAATKGVPYWYDGSSEQLQRVLNSRQAGGPLVVPCSAPAAVARI